MEDIQSIISMTDSLLSIIILLYALAKMSAALTARTNDYIDHLKRQVEKCNELDSSKDPPQI